MRTFTKYFAAAVLATIGLLPGEVRAEGPEVGAPAPTFSATDTKGKAQSLADLAGKRVVLEWHNRACPFVEKHYESGNMQKLQRKLTSEGVVWLTIISSAPGKQGHVTHAESGAYVAEQKAAPTAVIIDADGSLGRLYGAKTTPEMFLIDEKGILVYAGAIDDKPSTDTADIAGAKSYVLAAFEENGEKRGRALHRPVRLLDQVRRTVVPRDRRRMRERDCG